MLPISLILTETTNALLRHSQHFISAYSSVEKRWSNQDVIEKFKQVSKEEHKKFDIESLVNFNSVRSHRHVDPQPREPDKDYIVVTILVATKCGYNAPPTMNTIDDIKEALKFFIAIDINQILAVEVLWTPQHENDTLSQQELEGKYPLLKPINAS
ncbi:conserved hypothetical protein [Ricinus communis]|uniref:Uncharacterized protein n=1 Tax=Ricinus communis TaxID=3988 RepID=B9RTS7_RICCO|nr:conserved hypothetical protein [Ricinus communis]